MRPKPSLERCCGSSGPDVVVAAEVVACRGEKAATEAVKGKASFEVGTTGDRYAKSRSVLP